MKKMMRRMRIFMIRVTPAGIIAGRFSRRTSDECRERGESEGHRSLKAAVESTHGRFAGGRALFLPMDILIAKEFLLPR